MAIVGHFGNGKAFYDGQTIKTLTLRDGLEKYCGDGISLVCADTYFIKHNPFVFLWQLLKCLVMCDDIIVLLSKNGRKILFPVLYFAAKLFGKKIYHCSIGGRLADEADNPGVRKYIKSFRVNWVETRELEKRLREMGIENAEYLPNFKNINAIDAENIKADTVPPYRFCTFSRVMKEKGISDAINAVADINSELGNVATLDIFGAVAPEYINEFSELVGKNADCVKYCGTVSPNDSVSILSEYYMLLFPTHWSREGIPGTIIDALAAGLPVIARKWNYCDEMLEHGSTGYCYPYDEPQQLTFWIKTAMAENNLLQMRKNCLLKADEYDAQTCIGKIAGKLKE